MKGKDMVEWGVKQAKLAVAVAIIKSKPPGISGRQHAEHLASKLRSQDENWKKKFHQLQGEVLRLRQELLLTGSATDPLTSNMDSGCGTDHTETTTDAERPASPLATCARLPTSGLCEAGLHGKAALLHMQFLQSLLGLSRLGPDGDGDGSVMADSVSQLLTCLAAAASGDVRPLTPQSLLGQASRVAARAVDAWLSHREPPPRFAAHVEGVLDELVGMLLCNDQLNRFRVQERLTECLVLLGGSCYLRSLLISHGLSEINRMAEHLWITCQGESSEGPGQFDVTLYENSFYLFRLLEQLLQASQRPSGLTGGTSQRWSPDLGALQRSQEHRLLRLSEDFPLFVLYMWRIRPLLTPTSDTSATDT
uniref:Meiosis-specific protein MEI4 n=1 Tax=Esox lucius TaxID=8010 RepID=A0AAY5KRU5_ESOLU